MSQMKVVERGRMVLHEHSRLDGHDVYGVELLAASLNDIVRSKEAADRPQDRQDVVIIREMLRRRGGS